MRGRTPQKQHITPLTNPLHQLLTIPPPIILNNPTNTPTTTSNKNNTSNNPIQPSTNNIISINIIISTIS